METQQYFIGVMSGTSLDGVDIALVQIAQQGSIKLVDFSCIDLPSQLTTQLAHVSVAEQVNLQELGQLNVKLAKLFAQGCNDLLKANQLTSQQITAIGCHGITIRHCPELEYAFTWQITDANTLSALTNIDVVADFRGMDMAFNGQGAPLVPKFHQALLEAEQQAVFVNLGGIANITVIEHNQPVIGYDTGPANTLMNLWCQQHLSKSFDEDGQWARSGNVCEELLTQFLSDDYFAKAYPKSTGKEKFNLPWLQAQLDKLSKPVSPVDVQATLLQLTVKSIAMQIQQFSVKDVYLCGGGAQNLYFVEQLKLALPTHNIASTDALGVGSDEMEAMAFAWFAYCRINALTANVPSVTGAEQTAVLGAWYRAKSER